MRERHILLRAILSTLFVAIVAGTAVAQPPGRVNGVVRDDEEQPVKGATVTAQSENFGASYTATTDDKGRFTVIGLRPGEWTFIAQAPGYSVTGGKMNVRAASNMNAPMLFSIRRTGPGAGGALERITAKDLQSQLAAADALFNQKKWDDAIAAYRTMIASAERVSPDGGPIRSPLNFLNLQIAAAYVAKNDPTRAKAAYEELLRADPTSEKATVGLAQLMLLQGDSAAAEATLRRAAEGEAPGREVLCALGDLMADAGRDDEAADWFHKASASDPYWGKPLYRLGQLASAKGDASTSTTFMERVIAVDPRSPEAALAKSALQSSR
jgi:Carboxypeptidase regulatory-like domain/Tetratricopeptide repeat